MIAGTRSQGAGPVAQAAPISGASGVRRLEPVESALLFVALTVVLSSVRQLLTVGAVDAESGDLSFQLITLSICGLAFLIAARMGVPTWFPRLLWASRILLASVVLILASVAWSIAPDITFRRSVALALSTGFAFYVVARFDFRRFTDILLVAFGLFVVASYLAVLTGDGIDAGTIHAGSWRGFTGHKNNFGRVCALGLGLFVIFALAGLPDWRRWRLAGIASLTVPLLLSGSKTPILSLATALFFAVSVRFLALGHLGRLRVSGGLRFIVAVFGTVVLIVTITALVPFVLEALGRDMTLSGRQNVWEHVFLHIEDPLLGAGYRAFWTGPVALYYAEFFWWTEGAKVPTHSHSSYIDTYAELGMVGLVCLVGLLASAVRIACRCFRAGRDAEGYLLTMLLAFICVYGIAERVFFQHFENLWFLFTVAYLYGVRALICRPATGQRSPSMNVR